MRIKGPILIEMVVSLRVPYLQLVADGPQIESRLTSKSRLFKPTRLLHEHVIYPHVLDKLSTRDPRRGGWDVDNIWGPVGWCS